MINMKVEYAQQSKCTTAKVFVESDELSQEDILAKAKELADKAQTEATLMTMRMGR